jgi:conjugative relaxase-like TrwC/TraI family protein
MLTITALTNAEYVISSVALSIDEYYSGVGESPGVWAGKWAPALGLSGMVESDQLRALVEGRHPTTGVDLLAGHRSRSVRAFDLTFSAPKSASVLWALGSERVAEIVAQTHREAVEMAVAFLEERAAVTRIQEGGVRRRVSAQGWAVAGFVHRTSREGDPQLHTHCLVPNLVERAVDSRFVALDGGPLHDWCRAGGSVYQNELQRLLSLRLGVVWGPDRNNTREMVGFTQAQLRTFSKRTAQIEAELEHQGATYESPALRMRADDEVSLATRPAKDQSLTPSLLAGRWRQEATQLDMRLGEDLDGAVCWREPDLAPPGWQEVTTALMDEETGLCARSARFTEADAVEQLCAMSGGRLTVAEITEMAHRFLASELAVRLTPAADGGRRRPAEWSTAAHRALEDQVLALLDRLAASPVTPVRREAATLALAGDDRLGADQVEAVRVLTGEGGALRTVLAPAGYGKTAMAHAAASAATADGRPVLAVATTAKAVAELTEAGLAARTIAQLRLDLAAAGLAPGTVVVLDEISQTPTRDAQAVLASVAGCRDGMLWVLGDPRQSQPVAAGGVADEIQRRAEASTIPAGRLGVNRRQVEAGDRQALSLLRSGRAAESQQLRAERGWEHEHLTPWQTREAMADAVCAAISIHGAEEVAALAVSHVDAEDLADRIRWRLTAGGVLSGPPLAGPGWGAEGEYRAGDRVLLHARYGRRDGGLVNGTSATVERVDPHGLAITVDDGRPAMLPTEFVQGSRRDGSPNVSHEWARTVDGAQGGTWQCCHLLGSSALDAYRGYSGQSRSRQPTHTWNTATVAASDHGGVLADRRSPAQQVAAALARQPDSRLAAHSDPFIVERQLVAQIEAHRAVLDRQPPDRFAAVARADQELARAQERQSNRESIVAGTREGLDAVGTLSGLTRNGRAERRRWQAKLVDDLDAAEQARAATAATATKCEQLRRGQAAHDRFEQTHRWRRGEVAALRSRLDHHWADVIASCVRADNPLAYGIDKLRRARQTLAGDLCDIEASIPVDLDREQARTRRELVSAAIARREAQHGLDDAVRRAEQAGQRRWGRRDHDSITRARQEMSSQQRRLQHAVEAEAAAKERFVELGKHHQQRRHALAETHQRRVELTGALADIDGSLDSTRPERVHELAEQHADHLVRILGPVPDTPVGRDAWCHLAGKIETHLDRHPAEGPSWQTLCQDLRTARERLARAVHSTPDPATRPAERTVQARQQAERVATQQPVQTMWNQQYNQQVVKPSRGPELGL